MGDVAAPASAVTAASQDGAPSHRPRPAQPRLAALALAAGVATAIAAQLRIAGGASPAEALLTYGLAIVLFLAGSTLTGDVTLARRPGSSDPSGSPGSSDPSGSPGSSDPPTPSTRPGAPGLWAIRPLPALAALTLGVITFLASGGNRFTPLNLTTWVLSLVLGLVACREPRHRPRREPGGAWLATLRTWLAAPGPPTPRLTWGGLAFCVILTFGVTMLFSRIAEVPAEMTSDHAEKLLDVQDVLDGQTRIFFPRNTGREALQFYLIAVMTPLTGLTYLTMKLGTALVASFTLPFTFLLARLTFGTGFALLTMAILATTRWHWQVARVGLRFPFPPAFGAAIFYFLIRAIRHRRRNDFLWCGLALGLAQHTYTALRLAPVAVLACLGIALAADLRRRAPARRVRRLLVDTCLLGWIATLAIVPLARYATGAPDQFLFRSLTRIASDSLDAIPRNPLVVLLDNIWRAALMFNWRGDVVWVNTIPGAPMLDAIAGALFVLGCAYGLYRLVRFRELPYAYLFTLLAVGLLPSTLSLAYPGENPSTVRSGMAIPATVVFVAIPAMLLYRGLATSAGAPPAAARRGVTAPRRALAGLALLGLWLPMFGLNVRQYFVDYARQHSAASQHTAQVARVVNGFLAMGGRREDVAVLPWPGWFDARLVAIQVGDIRWQPVLDDLTDVRLADGVPRPRLYLVHPDDAPALRRLASWYPAAVQQVHSLADTGDRPYFVTVLVPPSTRAAPAGGG